jgi:sugar phosphate isomerase/epimerase
MMDSRIPRRQFLRAAGMFAASNAAGLGQLNAAVPNSASQTAPPIGKNMPRLFSGCCAYSYDQQMMAKQMTMEDFIRKAVDLRVDGADMTVYYLKSTDPAYLEGLRHLASHNAVPFSGAACGVSMVQANAAMRAKAVSDIRRWVDVTDRLGASRLRVFAGKLPSGMTLQKAIDGVVEVMKQACEYSGERGITLGMEDHSGISQSADVCLEIMHRVDSPYAGINLDITHFVPTAGKDAYAQIAACIPYATNTHIRDRFDDGTPIDLDRVWRMFAEGGYRGYMLLEYSPRRGEENEAQTEIPRMVREIRRLCGKYSSSES